MRKQFYEKALPSQGVYCVAGIKQGRTTHRFVETLADLDETIETLTKENYNTFVALNSFEGYSRRSESAIYAKCFFIDLDVGDDPKKYENKFAALTALGEFVERVEIPPPVVIDSGTGVHAYWLFDEDVESGEWKIYAEKFKAFCLQHLKIDPAVTADRARIMRCPLTFNYKKDPPAPTKFLTDDFYTLSFSSYKEFLGEEDTNLVSIFKNAYKGLDEDTMKMLKTDNLETLFSVIATRSLEGTGCNQIKYILEQAKTLPEPLWHSGLSIARHCEDWEDAIHLMSEDYPKYDRAVTIRKANETSGKPHGCDIFEVRNPGGCDGCPHKGHITNPLALGRQLREPDPEEDAVRSVEDTEDIYALSRFPDYLRPYQRGVNGGVYFAPPEAEPVLIWEHDVYPVKRMYGPQEGEVLLMRHVMPHDAPREFLLPLSAPMDEFKKILSKYGVLFSKEPLAQLMRGYIVQWAKYMIHKQMAEQTRTQMGWTEDNNGFVVGTTEYRRDGTTYKTAASAMIYSVAKLLKTEGDYDTWKIAANKLNMIGLEMHAFAMLCAFGSPLMRFTTTYGVSVCYTGESGAAKTGALFAGLSLFGDPKGLSVAGNKKNSATDNALVQWMMGLKNVMMGLDEASNRGAEELSDLIYKVTEGKNKLRMQASVNAIREIEATSSLINFMSSNHSVIEKLASYKGKPDGELARLLEFFIYKPQLLKDRPDLAVDIFDTLRTNYGFAGPEFIKYLFEVGEDVIRETVRKWSKRFNADYPEDTAHRFYDSLFSVAFAGGELANKAGIVSFDLERIYKKVMDEFKLGRENSSVKLNSADYMSILGDFQNENQGAVLIVNEGRVIQEPKLKIVARIEADKKMYYVSRTALKKYLRSIHVDEDDFVKKMVANKSLVYKEPKIRLTNGWSGRSAVSAVAVYGFKEVLPDEVYKVPDGT
jgi:hypothetical protein